MTRMYVRMYVYTYYVCACIYTYICIYIYTYIYCQKTTTLSLFLQSLFPKTDVLEEGVDLSYDRLLMNEWILPNKPYTSKKRSFRRKERTNTELCKKFVMPSNIHYVLEVVFCQIWRPNFCFIIFHLCHSFRILSPSYFQMVNGPHNFQ
jgi:hypothetical protein